MEKRKFYRCSICNNIFGVINDSGVIPVCCNQPMDELKANTSDGAGEKHIPVIKRNGDKVTIRVSTETHPMEDKHYIQWIILVQNNKTQRATLHPGEEPEATFCVDGDSPVIAYEYCNLHGLWMSEE